MSAASTFQPFAYGRITGTDIGGRRFVRLPVCIADYLPANGNEPESVKVWPDSSDPQLAAGDIREGTFRFDVEKIESWEPDLARG
jgi:hypothetical protein